MVARGERTFEESGAGHALRRFRRISGKGVRLETGGHVFGVHVSRRRVHHPFHHRKPRPVCRRATPPGCFANSDSLDTLKKEV
jgi:hypothetical protein